MDQRDQLTPLEGEELVGQQQDHSGLGTTLYPTPQAQWSGDIMSREEREKQNAKKEYELGRSILPKSFALGALLVLPFAVGLPLIVFFQNITVFAEKDRILYAIPAMVFTAIWIIISWKMIKKAARVLYNHTVSSAAYLLIHYLIMLLASTGIYASTTWLHHHSTYISVIVPGIAGVVASAVLAFILLSVWTARIPGVVKLALYGLMIVIAATFTAVSLLA